MTPRTLSMPACLLSVSMLALACSDEDGAPQNPMAPAGDGDENTMMPSAGMGDGDGAMVGDGDGPPVGDGDMMLTGDGDGTLVGDGDMMSTGDGDGMTMGDGDAMVAEPMFTHVAGGTFAPLSGYESNTASGAALIAVGSAGSEVSLQINGLTPMTEYPAHIHALPCSMSGGGHYKLDPSVDDTVADNEIWPTFTTDMEGSATTALSATHGARRDAMSIVIHDPAADNAKMLCADLVPDGFGDSSSSGTFSAFAGAEQGDQGIMGTATLLRSPTGTTVSVEVTGLTAGAVYNAHVHALPCGTGDAGGHYKLDPTVEEALEDNELWPAIMPDAMGEASGMLMSDHLARADAQSVVIHRMTMDGAPKVACADLSTELTPFTTDGDVVLFELAQERGLDGAAGSGKMERWPDGRTSVSLTVSGLVANTEYPVHVHDRPCGVASGGGHYKLDASVADTVETNEIWLNLAADPIGLAMTAVEVQHHARAEAQALVIHDGTDGMRLICIPLQ